MNKAILMGRLTREPEIRYSNGPEQTAVGRFTLAVDRRGQRQGNQQNADTSFRALPSGRRRSLWRNTCTREQR